MHDTHISRTIIENCLVGGDPYTSKRTVNAARV